MLSNARKFKVNADLRLNKAIKVIQRIGYLADTSNYSYTEEEVKFLSRILQREVRNTLKLFEPKIRERTILEGTFQLFKEEIKEDRDGLNEQMVALGNDDGRRLISKKKYPPTPSEGRGKEGSDAFEQMIGEAIESGKVKEDEVEDLFGSWDKDVIDIEMLTTLNRERSKYWKREERNRK